MLLVLSIIVNWHYFLIPELEQVQFGMPDERIGKIELEKLKRVAMQPHILQQVPSLEALIPFLDFHPNHKYLIQRFR